MARSRIRTGLFILLWICLFTGAVAVNTAGGPPAQLDDANVSVTQSPGTQFTGAVATEGVALENELHRRTVRISLARARTPDMKATVITENEAALDTQLDSLEARSARLVYALRTGRIEQDRYRAEAAVIDAEARGIEHRIDLLREAATRL
ncbi:MAG TPA: hypothetical protein VFJ06_13625, partial [Halococcus sp.]|nr:hypothetical protein [Halococcus sp.]